jgi:hypothetical protein
MEETCQIRQLLDPGGDDSGFDRVIVTYRSDFAGTAAQACGAAAGDVLADDFPFADQPRAEFGRPAALAGRAPRDHGSAAVLHNPLRPCISVAAEHLGNAVNPRGNSMWARKWSRRCGPASGHLKMLLAAINNDPRNADGTGWLSRAVVGSRPVIT